MAKQQDLLIKIQADTAKARKEIESISKNIKQLSSESDKVGKTSSGIEKVSKSYGGLSKTISSVVAGLSTLAIGIEAVQFAKLASEAEQSADAFDRVFSEMGLSAEEEFNKIKEASFGLIPKQAIQQSAVTAVSLGVPIGKLSELMEVARAKAREMGTDAKSAFNDLATGIGRGSPMILDNLGLTIKLGDANDAMAKSLGKSVEELTKQEKALALTNAVIEAGADSIERYAEAGLSSKEEFQQLQATFEDLKVELGNGLLKILVDLAKETNAWLDSLDPESINAFSEGIGKIGEGLIGILKTVNLLNDIALPDILFGEDAGLLGTVAEGWGKIGDLVSRATDEFDAVFSSMDQLEEQASKVDSLARAVKEFAGVEEELNGLESSLKKVYQENQKLIDKWSGSETELYREALYKLQEEQYKILDSLESIAKKKDTFKNVTDSAEDATDATKKLTEVTTEYSEENKRAIGEFYKDRLAESKKTLSELLSDEKKLTKDISDAHKKLAQELEKISSERFKSDLSYTDRIREAYQSTMSETQKFRDNELRADEKLALAEEALKNKQYDQYETYISQYDKLKSASISKEIRGGELVSKTKEQQQKDTIALIKQEYDLQKQYLDQKTKDAQTAHDLTVAQAEAERAGVQATLEAYKIMIDVMKQMVEATTGKKVEIDTSSLDKLIHKAEASNTLIESLENRQTKIGVDSSNLDIGKQKIEELRQITLNGITLDVKPNTTPASFGIKKFINEFDAEGNLIGIKVNPLWEEAKLILQGGITEAENTPIKKKLQIDTKEITDVEDEINAVEKQDVKVDVVPETQEFDNLDKELEDAIADVDAEVEIKPNTEEVDIVKEQLGETTVSDHEFQPDASDVYKVISDITKDTFSTHTIYVKQVNARADGGLIPQRLATGGVFGGSGRVPGYDPTDSDRVNAYLTGGEFVIKRSAVDMYGVAFLNALNNMKLPKIKGYATGGLVDGKQSLNSPQLRPIQLNVGNNSFDMLAPNDVAIAMMQHIENQGGM